MQCTKCGAMLSPGTTTCPRCGTPVSAKPPESADSSYGLEEESIPYMDFGPFMESVSKPPTGQLQNPPQSAPAFPQAQNPPPQPAPAFPQAQNFPSQAPYFFPRPQNPPAPPAYPFSQALPVFQQQPQSAAVPVEPQRRGLSRGMMILLIALAVLIIVAGGGLAYYAAIFRPAELKAQAASTAIAQTQATARVNAQKTAQAEATITALQVPYRKATSGTPLINDPLSSQSGSLWQTRSASAASCGFNSGAYHVKISDPNHFLPCFANVGSLSNLAFQVQMTILQGREGGLIFRATATNTSGLQGYFFGIDDTGQYGLTAVLDSIHGQSRNLASSSSSAVKAGSNQPNLLTVIAQGSTLTLYINKQYVTSVTDNTYSSGAIALYAIDVGEPADIAFSNAEVWTF